LAYEKLWENSKLTMSPPWGQVSAAIHGVSDADIPEALENAAFGQGVPGPQPNLSCRCVKYTVCFCVTNLLLPGPRSPGSVPCLGGWYQGST
jgi:hypothetical protein